MRNYDLEFLKKFSMVIGFLVLVTFGLMIGAYILHKSLPQEVPDAVAQRTQARIAPVGAVYAGSTGAAVGDLRGGTLDGSVIFNNLCTGCHTSGAGGAPTMDAAHWAARIPQGVDVLHQHAIEGYTGATGVMPPKGGNPALTDEQVIATVDWMLDNLK